MNNNYPKFIDPEEEDCLKACSEALLAIVEFLQMPQPCLISALNRIAALQVVTGRLSVTEAANYFGIQRKGIYRNVEILARELGREYHRGHVR